MSSSESTTSGACVREHDLGALRAQRVATEDAAEMTDRVRQRISRAGFVAVAPEHADRRLARGAPIGTQAQPREERELSRTRRQRRFLAMLGADERQPAEGSKRESLRHRTHAANLPRGPAAGQNRGSTSDITMC